MNESNLQDVYTLQIRRQANQKGASPYCTACKDGFLHVNSLQVRQFTETGKLPGVCKACNNAFLRICRLQIRHLTQADHQPHVCTICNKTFTHAGNYKKHKLLHERESNELKNGVQNGTDTTPKPPFHCDKCGRSFLKYGSFVKHYENHDNVQVFSCEVCDKNFKSKPLLKSHLRVHRIAEITSNAQVCKLCKKTFAVPEELAEHLLEHVNGPGNSEQDPEQEKPETTQESESDRYKHYCSVCQKGFVNLGALKNHFSLHTGDLAFECRKCKRRFMHAFNLKKHAKIHVKKTYSCKKCNKVYKSRKLLKKHSLLHKKK